MKVKTTLFLIFLTLYGCNYKTDKQPKTRNINNVDTVDIIMDSYEHFLNE